MALITGSDLATAMRDTLDPDAADQAAADACAAVESLTGPLEPTESTVVLPLTGPLIDLPSRVVTSVTAVTVDGTPVAYEWLRPYPTIRLTHWTPTAAWRTVEVTFVHGYPKVPPIARAVALEVAKRGYRNPSGVKSERIDDYQITHSDPGTTDTGTGSALTDLEIRQLERANLVVSAHVTGR